MEVSFQHSNCWSTWKKREIPSCSRTQPAGHYHVWAAHITQAIRGSTKNAIKKLFQTIRKNRLQQGGTHISGENYSALVWSQDKTSQMWRRFVLIWPQVFVFLIGTARDFFWFCKPGYPAHISISKVPLTLIKLDFMHLYQADIWQEAEWTQWLWQSWKKSVNGTGG